MQLNKDTLKFWSFKDTKDYKSAKYKHICNSNVYRRFTFVKSFLLKVELTNNKFSYVTPLCFMSYGSFPDGNYEGIDDSGQKIFFNEEQINEVYR
jgi:hypothetical protein